MIRKTFAWALLAGVVALICFCGCGRKIMRGGKEVNANRATRGIPIVPPSWLPNSAGPNQTDWVNPSFGNGTRKGAVFATKQVLFNEDGSLAQEINTYYSGRRGPYPGLEPGEIAEYAMYLFYDYNAEKQGNDPWSCEVNGGPQMGKYTLEEAVAILQSWGIPGSDCPVVSKSQARRQW